jgi:hypothetical protein
VRKGSLQDKMIKNRQYIDIVGHLEKVAGCEQPVDGVIPSDQRLKPDDLPAQRIELLLIVGVN